MRWALLLNRLKVGKSLFAADLPCGLPAAIPVNNATPGRADARPCAAALTRHPWRFYPVPRYCPERIKRGVWAWSPDGEVFLFSPAAGLCDAAAVGILVSPAARLYHHLRWALLLKRLKAQLCSTCTTGVTADSSEN